MVIDVDGTLLRTALLVESLIAYLKRLGTDLNKKSPEATATKGGN